MPHHPAGVAEETAERSRGGGAESSRASTLQKIHEGRRRALCWCPFLLHFSALINKCAGTPTARVGVNFGYKVLIVM